MKIAIYCRVSTEGQTTENQRLPLVDYAERQGWKYEVFEETETTRKTRPIKQALMKRLRKMEFDALLVLKLDRWARSLRELTLDIEELHNKNITFISLNDGIDLSTATGKLQFQILGAFAEFERNLISQRTLEGLDRARRQGIRLGRPPGSKDKKKRKRRTN
jgi:DNA invertase Pin-like site-specific DNA recombinase